MSGIEADEHGDVKLNGQLFLNVTFGFEEKWNIGPDGKLSMFPPGVGSGGATVEIEPVHLEGLSEAEIAQAIAKRAGEMALVATAIAVANRQFAEALSAAGYGATTR